MEYVDIYVIRNTLNNKLYIGQTKQIRKARDTVKPFGYTKRFAEHITASKAKPTYHIDRVIREFGHTNFTVELLEVCLQHEADTREVFHIQASNSLHPNGYNIVLGNPHKNFNPIHTSQKLKDYYNDDLVKSQHSKVHQGKFKTIDTQDIARVELRSINEHDIPKLVYMIIVNNNETRVRRRYGGAHITYESAYSRALDDTRAIVTNDKVMDYTKDVLEDEFKGVIDNVQLKLHKLREHMLVSVYVKTIDGIKRKVFGGKTVPLVKAFDRAIKFTKLLNISEDKISTEPKLMATLSNCGNPLRANATKA